VEILGLDIGGANIKAATADGASQSLPFALWRSPELLEQKLRSPGILSSHPQLVALTMTGELADCFATRADGVRRIIAQVQQRFPEVPIRVWLTSGEFAEPDDAVELWNLAAASNWHALATWVARAVPRGPALLVDIGSTTTDLIPLLDGVPVMSGRSDLERLAAGELIYSGVRRTPVCAVAGAVPLRINGRDSAPVNIPLAAELFATTQDVFLLTGDEAEDLSDTGTADGRAATREWAANRLAHQICCDSTDLEEWQLRELADWLVEHQVQQLALGVRRQAEELERQLMVAGRSGELLQPLVCGSGAFLAERVITASGIRCLPPAELSGMFVRNISVCAAAFATARLAAERCLDDLVPFSESGVFSGGLAAGN
jgi:probable H4MPT-linked C1 transfer pathway protein